MSVGEKGIQRERKEGEECSHIWRENKSNTKLLDETRRGYVESNPRKLVYHKPFSLMNDCLGGEKELAASQMREKLKTPGAPR